MFDGYRAWADAKMDDVEYGTAPPPREPLTANQHILHLLLTVCTGGLWGVVWFIRAWRGNPPKAAA